MGPTKQERKYRRQIKWERANMKKEGEIDDKKIFKKYVVSLYFIFFESHSLFQTVCGSSTS